RSNCIELDLRCLLMVNALDIKLTAHLFCSELRKSIVSRAVTCNVQVFIREQIALHITRETPQHTFVIVVLSHLLPPACTRQDLVDRMNAHCQSACWVKVTDVTNCTAPTQVVKCDSI